MAAKQYVVSVDRTDGSRTYKGPWTRAHCEREAAAWECAFPYYTVSILEHRPVRADMRSWAKTTRHGLRYYFPAEVA